MSKILLEKWNDVITAEGNKLKPVQEAEAMAQILENQEEYVLQEEQNNTGDMAPFFPILVPAVRRVFPGLLANDLVGVQPLNGPTGYAYAIRFRYGAGAEAEARPYPAPFDEQGLNRGDSSNPFGFKSWAIVLADDTLVVPETTPIGFGAGSTTEDAVVVYTEPGRILVDISGTAVPVSGGVISIDSTGTPSDQATELCLGNEAGFNIIFKNYADKVTTQFGEQMGQAGSTISDREKEMKTMKMSLERVAAEAQTRKLKAEYSMELAQDLKSVHGLNAEQELINIIEYEVGAEIDRELVDKMNTIATSGLKPWIYGLSSGTPIAVGSNVSDGRWEAEKFRTLYTRIVKEANTIALTTRRGAGNFIICSTNVATALESLSSFMYSAVPGTVSAGTGVSKVGVLDGRFTVYVDTFAMVDYITVGYKGPGAFDTGLVYCPYVPLMVQKVVDPTSFQPKIGFMTRYALIENLFGASNYYRRFFADFSGSSIAGSSLY